ncbi:MAG: tRNA (adenosine(37)-N6)-dimethylallyltransferase MiaA [Candidatus Komeilibacteria bacterium]|nr:tRNA (adenosine(37)-N6)-dimethylallyltransferase MiaA [Candidatus Komeilibacteria bacterium]
MNNKVIVILGPTASGKTKLGVALAKKFKGEIISADSRQVYLGMDIGTGKDLKEYSQIPHHLIDVKKPNQKFTVNDFQQLANKVIEQILTKNKVPIIVGGTGLYLQALIENYSLPQMKPNAALRKTLAKKSLVALQKLLQQKDLQTYQQTDLNNKRRLIRYLEIITQTKKPISYNKQPSPYQFLVLGLNPACEILYQKIDQRLKERLKQGLVAEVKKLKKRGLSWQRLNDFGLEYYWVTQFLLKKITTTELCNKLSLAIHHFAKRQTTWFKRMPYIYWLKNQTDAERKIKKFLTNF